ncbi:MAG: hypothetical protein ACRD3E_12175 [Terriglobales bacterium]
MKLAKQKPAADPEAQLDGFIAKFDAENQAKIRSIRKALQRRLRGANELVYDNYNFFVIGYSPTDRTSDAIVSLAAGANAINLCFPYCGAKLPDPQHILQGSGSKNRFVRLESAKTLARPEVEAVITAAVGMCKPLAGRGRLIIRSVSEKQRARRK